MMDIYKILLLTLALYRTAINLILLISKLLFNNNLLTFFSLFLIRILFMILVFLKNKVNFVFCYNFKTFI